jgi:hypothetical protein
VGRQDGFVVADPRLVREHVDGAGADEAAGPLLQGRVHKGAGALDIDPLELAQVAQPLLARRQRETPCRNLLRPAPTAPGHRDRQPPRRCRRAEKHGCGRCCGPSLAPQFFYQFIGDVTGRDYIGTLWENRLINVITCLIFLAIATAVA